MKTLRHAIFLLLFLPFLAFSQSPQCLNFTATGYLGNPVIQGNNVWFPASGALVKMDKTTGAQTVYRPDNSNMLGMRITAIAVSPNGTLWGGGNYGFWSFDGTSFTNYSPIISTGDTILEVSEIHWDGNGNMYMYCLLESASSIYQEGDFVKFDGTVSTRLYLPVIGYVSGRNNFICSKNNGEIYFGTGVNQFGDSCYVYDGTSWTALNLPGTNNNYYLVKNSSQEILAFPIQFNTTNVAVYKLVGTTWIPTTYYWANPPATVLYPRIAFSGINNDIYVYADGADSSNLLRFTGNVIALEGKTNTFEMSHFIHAQRGGNGEIWFTQTALMDPFVTYNRCLISKFDNGQWTNYSYTSNVYDPVAFKIDNFNRKWAIYYHGLSLFNGASWDYIPFPGSKSLSGLNEIKFDKYGDMWLILADTSSISATLYKYDGNWLPISSNAMGWGGFAIDENGRICIGENNGFSYFDGTTWQYFPGNATNYLNTGTKTIAVDKNNVFWLVSKFGDLVKFDGNTFTNQAMVISVSYPYIGTDSWIDENGYLWVLDGDGALYITDGNTLTAYSQANIPNIGKGRVRGGCRDLNGYLWLATDVGLFKQDGNMWTLYDLTNAPFSSRGTSNLYVDKANNLWFLGNGVTVFNESGIGMNTLQTNYNAVTGNVFLDLNGNGWKNTFETVLFSQQIQVQPDNINVYSNNNGNYTHFPTVGNHTLAILPYPNWQLTSDSAVYHVVGGVSRDSLDFGLKAISPRDSIEVTLYAGQTRCDTDVPYWIYYKNKGTTPLSGTLVFTIDPLTTLNSAFPIYNSNSTYTYTWNYQNLAPFQTQSISLNLQMPNANFIGTAIQTVVTANAATVSATVQHIDTLTCAFDPNDKAAILPNGSYIGNYVLQNTPFTYLIRFQNTGNDVAFNVTIADTFDTNWDMSTFQVLDYSHPLQTTYMPNGIVKFHFPNIMLPDSGTNEPASHGFVSYYVKSKPNIPDFTTVENTAFIYFDSNTPVVTNTTSHIFTSALSISSEKEWVNATWYPNPMGEYGILSYDNPLQQDFTFTLFDVNGKIVYQTQNDDGKIEIKNQREMASGVYLFRLTDGKETLSGKWLKK